MFAEIFLFGILIILLIVALIITEAKYTNINYIQHEIPKFNVNIKFDEYPKTINVENRYDCNANKLRECKLDDPSTLFGCKELNVKCVHFKENTDFWENGNTIVIPKNINKDTGYALSIVKTYESCNPFHGDLVLVTLDIHSNDYMLICSCKQPGFIGNDNLLGSCSDVFICNGDIDDINQPLESISCKCKNNEINDRQTNGVPFCRKMLIKEANDKHKDWTNLVNWSDKSVISKSIFNPTIRDNLNVNKLLNPCTKSLISEDEVYGGSYKPTYNTCTTKDYGLSVNIGLFDNAQHDDTLTSGVVFGGERVDFKISSVDAVIPTGKWKSLRFIDNVGGVRRKINVETTLPFLKNMKTVYVNTRDNIGYGESNQMIMSTNDQMLGGKCNGEWPMYSCYLSEYYSKTISGIPNAGYRSAPGSFIWGTETWENAEQIMNSGLVITKHGLSIDHKYFNSIPSFKSYGLQLCASDNHSCINGPLSFKDDDDYRLHASLLS